MQILRPGGGRPPAVYHFLFEKIKRYTFRRTVVPSQRCSVAPPKFRCAAIRTLRPKRRSKSELKPKTSEELKPKTSELQPKS